MNYLRKLKPENISKVGNWCAVDTEDDTHGNMKLCIFYDINIDKFAVFENENTMQLRYDVYQFLKKIGVCGYKIFAMGLEYDLGNIFGENYKFMNPIFSGSVCISAKLKFNKKTIFFHEAYAQIPFSVKKLGEMIGIPKIEKPPEEKIDILYCKRDCLILAKSLQKIFIFDERHKIDFGITLAQKALKTFRRQFLHASLKQYTFENWKGAYHGGRTENYKVGTFENIGVYDVNSLYPYVMLTCDFPYLGDFQETNEIVPFGVYQARVVVKDTNIPILGTSFNYIKKYIFPIGEFFGQWTGIELLYAIEQNQLIDYDIFYGIEFENMGKVFGDFIVYFYDLRKLGDEFENKILKQYMNSLSGKFAQGKTVCQYNSEEDVFEFVEKEKYPQHTNYIWSIFITSYARKYLHQLMSIVPYNQLVYCDTDSIHVTGNVNLISYLSESEIGKLKIEGVFEKGLYVSPKVYALYKNNNDIKVRAKGIPKDHRLAFVQYGEAVFKRPVKLRQLLRARAFSDAKLAKFRLNEWIEIKKCLKTGYDKRIVLPGGDTKPLFFT